MKLVHFEKEHLKLIELQNYQAFCQEALEKWEQATQFQNQDSYTLFDDEGKVLIIVGMIKIWGNRYAAWSLISKHVGKHFIYITRGIRKFLEVRLPEIDRLECYVDTLFHEGQHFLASAFVLY